MAHKKQYTDNFADLVARLNQMSNMTPEEERASLMEAASHEPKILDDKEVSLADIAKLAGIKEYAEPVKHSAEAEKLVESIVAEEPKTESDITKAIKESDADDSMATTIKKSVNEESKRLDKIAELETQLAELKSQEKEDATMDDKAFREVFLKDITEFVKEADANDLVEMYNKFSGNEVEANENAFVMKTPETKEIIADAEQAEAPEEVVQEKEPEEETNPEPEEQEGTPNSTIPLEDEDVGEDVELDTPANEVVEEEPAEDKFTNDLDPADKK